MVTGHDAHDNTTIYLDTGYTHLFNTKDRSNNLLAGAGANTTNNKDLNRRLWCNEEYVRLQVNQEWAWRTGYIQIGSEMRCHRRETCICSISYSLTRTTQYQTNVGFDFKLLKDITGKVGVTVGWSVASSVSSIYARQIKDEACAYMTFAGDMYNVNEWKVWGERCYGDDLGPTFEEHWDWFQTESPQEFADRDEWKGSYESASC
ncbi:uncharacterized protein SPPG_01337 [Spizellomyces punctatus DAOM BR117]|uniref:Uncharacterized protein n=1 Tax=Spizellomyces punctatus (strain DAOM BR117) TaxID=645134 RepID=A0A0L0HRY2_SPIPD|nr:uncharacterized protein SPPG_01337 [Spizellomyces punctatus DAOM BR117]KND03883.1 hypothetical protein SPPG_01337 [Spizellomyces punctatus DAOM BR117]|eukprot:XP_016611922.1 hypothetical protein SPPG_01337 [Spizellomyces punctatus DAOM BR117]